MATDTKNPLEGVSLDQLDLSDPETRQYVSQYVDMADPETAQYFRVYDPNNQPSVPMQGEDGVSDPKQSKWQRALTDAQGQRPGLDPENEFGGPRFFENGLPNPLSTVRDATDVVVRGLEYGSAVGQRALELMDDAARYTGLSSIPQKLGIDELMGNPGGEFLPGSMIGALGDAFPLDGAEAGLINPAASAVRKFSPEVEQAYVDIAKSGSADDIMRFSDSAGLRLNPEDVANFVKERDSGGIVDPNVRYRQLELPLEEQGTLPFEGPTPAERAMEARLRQEADAFQANKAEDSVPDLRQRELDLDKPAHQRSFDFGEEVPQQKAINSRDSGETISPEVTAAVDHINEITRDWSNAPSIEVFDNFDDLKDVDADAIGVTRPDGSVAINMANVLAEADAAGVSPEDILSAVTFHESLGHYGLIQRFGEGLDSFLESLYRNSDKFQSDVKKWMSDNPEAYADDPNPLARAAEEVLAEMSEKGRISPTTMDRIRNWIKGIGREMGLYLKYSDREIKSILSMAHDSVVKGAGRDVALNGFRYSDRDFSHLHDLSPAERRVFEEQGFFAIDMPPERLARLRADPEFQSYVTIAKSELKAAERNRYKTRREKSQDATARLESTKPGETKTTQPFPEEEPTYWRFRHVTDDGKEITGFYNVEDGALVDFNINSKAGPGGFGPRTVRSIARSLLKEHPEAKRISGYRISGARIKGTGKSPFDAEFVESGSRFMKRRTLSSANDNSRAVSNPFTESRKAAPQMPKLEKQATDRQRAIYYRKMAEYHNARRILSMKKGDTEKAAFHEAQIESYKSSANRYAKDAIKGTDRLMKRRTVGKGSNGPLRGSAATEDVETPSTISKFRSERPVEDILSETAPERTRESWDQWIDEAGKIKMTGKMAQNLVRGTEVPELKAAERFLLESANRIFDLSRKVSQGLATERETYLLGEEIKRARNVSQSIHDVVSNSARILNSRKIEVASDRALSDGIRNMLRTLDDETINDPVKLAKVAAQLEKGNAKAQQLGKLTRAWVNAINLPRSLMSSIDLSAPLRQGIFFVGRKELWKNIPSMFKQLGSDTAFKAAKAEIEARPTYRLMEKSGLEIAELGQHLSRREEQFISTWAENIPIVGRGVRASERAYTGFLNKLRADVFDDLVRQYDEAGIDLAQNDKALKDIARFVNNATGRGDLGKWTQAGPALSGVFFSPRLIASRVNLLNPATYVKLDPIVRRNALKSLASFGGIATSVAMLAKMMGADVETDPRSSDFAKIKVGDTRYDILGGFGQYITLASRLATNSTKNAKGEVSELGARYGLDDALDVLKKFARNKLAPVPGYAVTARTGKNPIGEEYDPVTDTRDLFIPLFLQDAASLIKEEGAKGIPLSLPGLFGVGMQTYGVDLGYDAFGRDIKSVLKEGKEEDDPVILEVHRLNTDRETSVIAAAPKSFKAYGVKHDLTEEQRDQWQQIMGSYTHEYLTEDMKTEDYITGSDEDKVEIIKQAHRDAYEDAKADMMDQLGITNEEEE